MELKLSKFMIYKMTVSHWNWIKRSEKKGAIELQY